MPRHHTAAQSQAHLGYKAVVYYSQLMTVAYGDSAKEAALDGNIIRATQLEAIAAK